MNEIDTLVPFIWGIVIGLCFGILFGYKITMFFVNRYIKQQRGNEIGKINIDW